MDEDVSRRRLEDERLHLTLARRAPAERLAEDESRLAPPDRSESAPDFDQLDVAFAVAEIIDAGA